MRLLVRIKAPISAAPTIASTEPSTRDRISLCSAAASPSPFQLRSPSIAAPKKNGTAKRSATAVITQSAPRAYRHR
jgi:hypothetical protein